MAEIPRPRVIGERRRPGFDDLFHRFLRWSWPGSLGAIAAAWLLLNVGFALAYFLVGGVANARPGSFADAFYFSVQTMGTIGYGAMAPASDAANLLVVLESVTSLVVTAVASGLVFAKFARTPTRVQFMKRAVLSRSGAVPSVRIRVGNARDNLILDARFRLTMVRTETHGGAPFYKMYDLPLTRDGTAALSRSYVVIHEIGPASPLAGYDAESLARDEVGLTLAVSGYDDTTLQPVHALANYEGDEILFDHRPADMISFEADGTVLLDMSRFDEVVDERA